MTKITFWLKWFLTDLIDIMTSTKEIVNWTSKCELNIKMQTFSGFLSGREGPKCTKVQTDFFWPICKLQGLESIKYGSHIHVWILKKNGMPMAYESSHSFQTTYKNLWMHTLLSKVTKHTTFRQTIVLFTLPLFQNLRQDDLPHWPNKIVEERNVWSIEVHVVFQVFKVEKVQYLNQSPDID